VQLRERVALEVVAASATGDAVIGSAEDEAIGREHGGNDVSRALAVELEDEARMIGRPIRAGTGHERGVVSHGDSTGAIYVCGRSGEPVGIAVAYARAGAGAGVGDVLGAGRAGVVWLGNR
jgi:hypothetical protein